jgi:transcriptional regulator with XRE-family HTH domain
VNYHDEEIEIDAQIRAELHRLKEASNIPAGTSPNPAELRTIFQNSTVQKVVRKLPLSSYFRKIRTYAEATVEDFAAALNVSPDLIRKLETNESEPWNLPAQAVAEVASGLRLHLTALETLTQNSHTVARLSKTLSDPQSAPQLMVAWLHQVRSELQRRGATSLLED